MRYAIVLAIAGVAGVVSCGAGTPPRTATPSLVFGCATFTPTTGAADLARLFGAANVTHDSIALGEGESEKGTVLFAGDSLRRVDITWFDPAEETSPRFVRLAGEHSLWRTPSGIHLGTTLSELEKLNNWPIRLAGFGWDRGGAILDWGDGAIVRENTATCRLSARLQPPPDTSRGTQQLLHQVTGDRAFSSEDSAMRALDPHVVELRLDYGAPGSTPR